MRKRIVYGVLALGLVASGCGLGVAGIIALATSGVTGVGAGVTYYLDHEPTATATPTATETPAVTK